MTTEAAPPVGDWRALCPVEEAPPAGKGRELLVADRIVALFNVEGQFYALDGVCPHQGGPLGKGCLTGHLVMCPWHGWQFDVRTGQHRTSQTVRQPALPLAVRGGMIFVQLSESM